jgi:hypothetical protein
VIGLCQLDNKRVIFGSILLITGLSLGALGYLLWWPTFSDPWRMTWGRLLCGLPTDLPSQHQTAPYEYAQPFVHDVENVSHRSLAGAWEAGGPFISPEESP